MADFIPYHLPDMPYDFSALEPVISGEIMQLHYTKHHNAYVTNFNMALEQYQAAAAKRDVSAMLALQAALRFNGGGHVNHSLFWTNLAPINQGGGGVPEGDLFHEIQKTFGSVDKFIEKMSAQSVSLQGSGWSWLGWNPQARSLSIATCPNQDPLSIQGLIPLLGIDVWEHAYYLQYKNVRADYVKNIWKVINWKSVQSRFIEARK